MSWAINPDKVLQFKDVAFLGRVSLHLYWQENERVLEGTWNICHSQPPISPWMRELCPWMKSLLLARAQRNGLESRSEVINIITSTSAAWRLYIPIYQVMELKSRECFPARWVEEVARTQAHQILDTGYGAHTCHFINTENKLILVTMSTVEHRELHSVSGDKA